MKEGCGDKHVIGEDDAGYGSVEEIQQKYFKQMIEAMKAANYEGVKEAFFTAVKDAHDLGHDEAWTEAEKEYTAQGDYEADREHERSLNATHFLGDLK